MLLFDWCFLLLRLHLTHTSGTGPRLSLLRAPVSLAVVQCQPKVCKLIVERTITAPSGVTGHPVSGEPHLPQLSTETSHLPVLLWE